MYRLSFAPAAERQWHKLIRRISLEDHEALGTAIEALAANPRPSKALKVFGEKDAYRLRVGDFRVIYRVDDPERSVTVAKVARRSEGTYRRLQ